MINRKFQWLLASFLATTGLGCAHFGSYSSSNTCEPCQGECQTGCQTGCEIQSCNTCEKGGGCGTGLRGKFAYWFAGWRSNAIPDTLPLGSTVRSHYQVMQTNAEAADFILHRNDFVADTAELTSDGKDKVMEIAARMRSDPFPVLIERSENNSNPELDAFRRNIVAQVLFDHGNPDADQRTIVSTAYGPGYNSLQSEADYNRYLFSNGGNNGNFGGGFGGGSSGGLGGGGSGR